MKLAGGEIGRGKNAAKLPGDSTHRSVYLPLIRGAVPASLSVFDVADPSFSVGQREVTTVATQALFLMNSPFVIENCQATANPIHRRSQIPWTVSMIFRTISSMVNSAEGK